ncbi:MAG: DUF2088 domain-containing protein, partial [Proteobacteria bacterium]|nr:DUF2088 domain-containing protein [Pseudomonadota bacterium]
MGHHDRLLSDEEVRAAVLDALGQVDVAGRRVLLILPDHTRTAPIGRLFRLIHEAWADKAEKLDCLIALGTHPPMSEEMIYQRVEMTREEHQADFADVRFFNHQWKDPESLTEIGRLSASDIGEITDGLFEMDVAITVNRLIFDYDLLLIVGPVFPHEVVGFSGGNKYLFPGIAGEQIIDFFHWLGAVITNPVIIGNKWTPVRKVVDRAAAMVETPTLALSLVVKGEGLAGLYFGSPEDSWSLAADLSDKLHITYKDKPFRTVLSCAPAMYDDIWTAGKCMYKLEPVVADGGTLIIHAPHVKEVSVTHGAVIEQVGYHTRDYFLKQWDKFKHHPWGVLAHCTHVKGIGTFENGVERPRVNVVLATQIP